MPRALKKDDDTDHFHELVKQPLRDKMLEVATAIKDDFISDTGTSAESYGCSRVNAIYGYHISGFFPAQMGGYEISEFYGSDVDSSYHFTRAQTEAMNEAQDHLYKAFAQDYKAKLLAAGVKEEKLADLDYGDIEQAKLENIFSDYENDGFEPALLRCELWADDGNNSLGQKGEPVNIMLRVSLNYTDQPYYRSRSDNTLFEKTFTIKQFMRCTPAGIVRYMKAALSKVE